MHAQATDTAGQQSRQPPFNADDARKYFGTVVASTNDSSQLPVMEWCALLRAGTQLLQPNARASSPEASRCRFAPDAGAATSTSGGNGSSVYFLNRFYDNILVERTGVTSVNWPKPKLKFTLNKKVRRLSQCCSGRASDSWLLREELAV